MTGSAVTARGVVSESDSIQVYARLAGALGLVSMVFGGFGEAYVPSVIAGADAETTAGNLLAAESLFRWGFASYLVEAFCDATLTMLFWVLLRPVHRNLAMLMVVFRIISTAGFAGAEAVYFSALPTLKSESLLSAIGPGQQAATAFTLLDVAGFGQSLFSGFYGVGAGVLGWLVYRSGYIPRILGTLLMVMGVAFVARTFLLILAPAYASPVILFTAAVAMLPFSLWLVVKGVDAAKYRERTAP